MTYDICVQKYIHLVHTEVETLERVSFSLPAAGVWEVAGGDAECEDSSDDEKHAQSSLSSLLLAAGKKPSSKSKSTKNRAATTKQRRAKPTTSSKGPMVMRDINYQSYVFFCLFFVLNDYCFLNTNYL